GVQLEEKREQSSRKFGREGLILPTEVRASDDAAGVSGERKLFLEGNQNGLLWAILEGGVLGGARRFLGGLIGGATGLNAETQRRREAMNRREQRKRRSGGGSAKSVKV